MESALPSRAALPLSFGHSDPRDRPLSHFIETLEKIPTTVGLLTFVLGLVVAGIAARFQTYGLREELSDPPSWPHLIERFDRPGGEAYFKAIAHLLAFADRFYGPRLIGSKALTRCTQLALLYPIVALVFGWILFDAGRIGGLLLLKPNLSLSGRLIDGVTIFAAMLTAFFCVHLIFRVHPWLIARFVLLRTKLYALPIYSGPTNTPPANQYYSGFGRRDSPFNQNKPKNVDGPIVPTSTEAQTSVATIISALVAFFSCGYLAGIGAFYEAIVVSYHVLSSIFVVVLFLFLSLFAIVFLFVFSASISASISARSTLSDSLSGAVFAAFLVAIAVSLPAAFAMAFGLVNFTYSPDVISVVLCFGLLLPVTNGLADLFSVTATRYFLHHLSRSRSDVPQIMAHLGADLVIAALCLVGLLLAIISILELWSWMSPTQLSFNWAGLLGED